MINASIEKALYYVSGNGNFQNVSVNDLESIAKEYPYFGVSQLLLSTKMKLDQHAGYNKQVQQTALHFPNISWLHYQLSNDVLRQPVVKFKEKKKEETQETNVEEAEIQIATAPLENKEEPLLIDDELYVEESEKPESLVESNASVESLLEINEDQIAGNDGQPNNDKSAFTNIVEGVIEEIGIKVSNTNGSADGPKESDEEQAESPEHALAETDDLDDQDEKINSFENAVVENESIQQEEEMAAMVQEPSEGVNAFLNEAESEVIEQENARSEEQAESKYFKEPEELDEHETMFRNIKAMLDASTDEAGSEVFNDLIPMDPYHTIDYFASQGIRLDLDNNADDKLGKQLKKFTHWLRHMKKLGPEDAMEEISKSDNDVEIQNFANSSNTAKEVVTEAMALVLEKQGKNEKAIQLYQKLSFLNPDKSSYFADKIKNLNNN